jgi:hypothetical protein
VNPAFYGKLPDPLMTCIKDRCRACEQIFWYGFSVLRLAHRLRPRTGAEGDQGSIFMALSLAIIWRVSG